MNIFELKDNYPLIDTTRRIGNRNFNYQYNILKLGYYPKDARRTKRSGHRIPNNYQVKVLIYKQNITCQIIYQSDGRPKFYITWIEKETKKKHKIISIKSASDASQQFIKVRLVFEINILILN